jgi:hypothetical protein
VISWAAATVPAGGPAVTGYLIYRNGSQIASIGAVTSYTDTSATAGNSYSYQVVATNGVGNTVSATSVPANILAQAAPTSVTATLNGTATAPATTANLSWTAATVDSSKPAITSTRVYNNGVLVPLAGVGVTGLRVTITGNAAAVVGLTANTTYNFTVGSINVVGTTQSTPAVSVADVVQAAPAMATPTFLTGGQVQLNWTQNPTAGAYAVKGYSLYRVNGGGGNTLVTTTTTPATSYTLTLAAGNNTYVVNAYNDAGPSGNSGQVTVNTALPSTPTQNALGNVSATSATVNWTASTVTASQAPITGYQILVGVDGAAPSAVATTSAGTLSQAVNIAVGHSYVFQVKAQSASGTTVASNSVTLADVATPALASAVRNGTTNTDTVGITWTAQASTSPVTTYNVDYSTSTNFTGGTTTTLSYTGATLPAAGTTTTTTFTNVARGTNAATPTSTVYFRVRALNAANATIGTSPTLTVLPASLK